MTFRSSLNYFDYSHHFDNEIKLFLTQSDSYWNNESFESKKDKIAKTFHLEGKKIVTPRQTHGDSVVLISARTDSPECDAIIYTKKSKIVGTINVADCIPICIYDSYNHNIALVHAGWRGTHKKIILKTIDALENLGSQKESINIFLGPSIKGCCYEVKEEFSKEFNPCATIKRKAGFSE